MTSEQPRGGVLWRTALIFVPLAAVGALVMWLLYRAQADAIFVILEADERQVTTLGREAVDLKLAEVVRDLRFLAEKASLREWLSTGDPAARMDMANDYRALAVHKGLYDQIRLFDAAGGELVRIEGNAGRARIVPDTELQDKGDRYYIGQALALGSGQIYVSPFDLNIERGAIEQPLKPTIRFATPVFDAAGRKRGIVILNYLGAPLLDHIKALAVHALDQVWLLNAEGHWLLGPGAEEEWGFMYPDRRERTFARANPRAWERMRGGGAGQFREGGALITFATVSPGAAAAADGGAGQRWILVSHVRAPALAARTAALAGNFASASLVLALLLALVAWGIAHLGERRRQAERRMSASEQRFRSLIESAPDGVVVTEADGTIALANAETERLFGYARDDLIGQSVDVLVPDRHRPRHGRHREGYVASPRPRAMGAGMALAGRRKDGSEFPVAISLSPARTERGVMVFCDIRDITEQREAEERIRQLNERLLRDNAALAAVNKELEAFSYSVSHDLRAPLRAIDGFSQALQEDCADRLDDDGRNHLARVRQAAQRMGQLIDDLLKLARVARTELSTGTADLSAMAAEIVAELQHASPGRRAEIAVADGLAAEGDPRLLRIALENLLSNAWKFTAGREPARIELGRATAAAGDAFFVRDNGVGFDMAYSGKLFGAFQRLHDAKAFPGTGIGLATVQRIVLKHGGRIWAESAPDRGATFWFTLAAMTHDKPDSS